MVVAQPHYVQSNPSSLKKKKKKNWKRKPNGDRNAGGQAALLTESRLDIRADV